MKMKFFILIAAAALLLCLCAPVVSAVDTGVTQAVTDWQKLLGGSGGDDGFSIQQTNDGGYILTGYTSSSVNGDVGANHGGKDVWLVKLGSTGNLQWQRVMGGTSEDVGQNIQQTSDGGYILTGSTYSSANGDVTGTNHGGADVWLVKLDSAGMIQWQKLLGGSGDDVGYSIQQTSEGGYILTGSTYSSTSGDVTGTNHGSNDVWVVKLDSAGMIQWQRMMGGSSTDFADSIQQTSEGGYILTGFTSSSVSGDVTGTTHGNGDVWVVKLDSAGMIQWQKLLGGSRGDYGYSIQQTSEGGYILTGCSSSSASGDVTGTNHGSNDVWLVKLDSAGMIQWQKLLGGSGWDVGYSIQQTSEGGYILTGVSSSSASGDVTGTNHGSNDVWLVKLDSAGMIQWQKLLGGSDIDYAQSIQQTSEGGYILTGYTYSSASGDITGTTHGGDDVWVVKLREIPIIRLSPGWNFVSTPKVLKSGSDTAGAIFSGVVNTDGHSIFLYDAATKTWVAMTASSKVKVLDGIWIYSTSATTVPLNPDPNPLIVPGAKTLSAGWNAIGFSDIQPATARDTLTSVQPQWSTVLGFDAAGQRYETSFMNGGTGIHSDYSLMNPPKGYWLWMRGSADLSAVGA